MHRHALRFRAARTAPFPCDSACPFYGAFLLHVHPALPRLLDISVSPSISHSASRYPIACPLRAISATFWKERLLESPILLYLAILSPPLPVKAAASVGDEAHPAPRYAMDNVTPSRVVPRHAHSARAAYACFLPSSPLFP
ncbi:hypothetical protein C8R44DRAFT_874362 [Mycena epipterygia]|nr:hypothetical protein C8R44DRAFT_874362 [Mycena epipterygia]